MNTIDLLNLTDIIILSIAGFLFIIQLFYYIFLYNRINKHNKACDKANMIYNDEQPPLSVIICTHNDSHNLRKNLPYILEQDYPNFEVIVINDGSTDESDDVLKLLSNQYPHLYHTFVPEGSRYLSRKKLAITLGIKASKNQWLVFTEPNCIPSSKSWLKLMARNFTSDTQIVLGYSNCNNNSGWKNKRIVFDLFFSSIRFLGLAIAGKPYMGIGRNMAYQRSIFFENKGYSKYLNLLRGEDDLFINQIASASNTKVETNADATMKIDSYERYRDWENEKANYMITSRFFKGNQRQLLGFETFSRILFYIIIIACITTGIMNKNIMVIGCASFLFLVRYTIQAFIINKTLKNLGHTFKYITLLPVFDMVQPIQTLILKIKFAFRNKKEYKRR